MDIIKKVKDVFVKKTEDKKTPSKDPKLDALMAEKEKATKDGKPWVAVLNTHINKDNIKNGFFELDWNNQFIEELLDAGYQGETNEAIVDAWFKSIVVQMLEDEGMSTDRDMGYINVVPLDKGKSEVS